MLPGGPTPPERARPVPVAISSLLLILVTAASLTYLGGRIAITPRVRDALEDVFGQTEMAGFIGFYLASLYVDAVVYVIFGLVLGILGMVMARPRNGARIATWVVGGLGVCCGGVSLVGAAFSALTGMVGGSPETSEQAAEVERILADDLPGWYQTLNLGASAFGVLALLVVLVLLALPASNEFFRRPEPGHPPPFPSGYPPPPGYPSPGYPSPGYPSPGYPSPGYPSPGYPSPGLGGGPPAPPPLAPPAPASPPPSPAPPAESPTPDPTSEPPGPPSGS